MRITGAQTATPPSTSINPALTHRSLEHRPSEDHPPKIGKGPVNSVESCSRSLRRYDGDDSDMAEEVVYAASFEELTANHVKDLSSRKLYVTPTRIVYKISRPSFIPFWRPVAIENQVPLSLVIDIIIEQGWLQSIFGMHTFRIESIAHGKAAPVDEIQVQGISNPGLLRKVIITEASKAIQDSGRMHKPSAPATDGENVGRATSVTDGSTVTVFKSPSKSWKITGSPRIASVGRRNIVPNEVLLHKLEEVSKSVRKLEFLVEKSPGPESS
ncbi:hypothetical protein MLD38_040685 [Melastoma candidum]|nr:hypothetical protein MLD38_040685 [Melastoma candidum]